MGVNFFESWLVEFVKVFYDFDNLLLEEVGRMKEISYFLEDFCGRLVKWVIGLEVKLLLGLKVRFGFNI